MLYDGAILLFSHDEVASGTDLAKLYVDTLNQAEADPEEIHFLRISKLYQLMPCDNVDKPVYLTTCLKKSLAAATAVVAYTEQHPKIKSGPPYNHPLLNFLWFLLLSVQTSQSLSAYTVLCEKYKHVLDRDPQYLEYLDKIGQHFFGVPAPVKAKPGGMFSGLFDQLLSAMNEEEEEEAEVGGPSTSAGTSAGSRASPKKALATEDLD